MKPRRNNLPGIEEPRFPYHIVYDVIHSTPLKTEYDNFCRLIVVRCGQGKLLLENRRYDIAAGDVFLIQDRTIYGFYDSGELELCSFQFDPEIFLDRNTDLLQLPGYTVLFHFELEFRQKHHFRSKLHLDKNRLNGACELIAPLEEECRRQQPGHHAMITFYFGVLVGFLARQYEEPFNPQLRQVMSLARVTSYIQANYQNPLTLDELAKVANMSKNSLLRAFNRCYSDTPIAYLIDLRLRKASALLKIQDFSITDIAFAVGFGDSNYFTRQFHRIYGMTPKEYRTLLQGHPDLRVALVPPLASGQLPAMASEEDFSASDENDLETPEKEPSDETV